MRDWKLSKVGGTLYVLETFNSQIKDTFKTYYGDHVKTGKKSGTSVHQGPWDRKSTPLDC